MKWFIFFVVSLIGLGLAFSNHDHYRLPTDLVPLKYNLKILTHLDGPEAFTFSGSVRILIEASGNTKNITLHSKDLTIDESRTTLTRQSGRIKDICVSSTAVNPTHDYYILNTCQELLTDHFYELRLFFSGKLYKRMIGYYRSSYHDPETNETRWTTVTQFEPTAARMAFPCFDEPNYKANFVVSLGHHQKYNSLSNMPAKLTKRHKSLPNYIWTEFKQSVPMSTYLVAFSINDFSNTLSTLPNGTIFRTWARPNAIDQSDFAAEFGPKVLQYYENLFGINFPLPKIDQIAIPDFDSGAMENWGLVTYRETSLLYSNRSSSDSARSHVATVIAHELAHQWFGNLVTMKWWTDLWLNEGFATYVANLGVAHIHPEWRSKEKIFVDDVWETLTYDCLESSHPVSRPIESLAQIWESFNVIAYKKGSSLVQMMHMFLGEEAFRSGLNSYLQKYKYQNAEQDNLWESLTQAAHMNGTLHANYDVKTIMDTWTLKAGYPVIQVIRDYAAGSAHITQLRYLSSSEVDRSLHEKCWWVPLSYTTQSMLEFNTMPEDWLECSNEGHSLPKTIENLPGADQWVIFNTQLSAPYRVNYDAQNWKLLIQTLNSKDFESIHVINRAQLINDVLNLAWIREQNYETAFELMEYLHREPELLPWRAALDGIWLIDRIVRRASQGGLIKRYLNKLLPPIYEYVNGINDTFSSIKNQEDIMLKIKIVGFACKYQVGDCVPRAVDYFHQWQEVSNPDEENPVPVNVRSTVYCTAIRHGSDEDWEFLWERYTRATNASEKLVLLDSLGCTQVVWLLQRILDVSFDSKGEIRRQDVGTAFEAVANNPVGFLLARQYFMHNLDRIYSFFQPVDKELARLLVPLSTQIINDKEFTEFWLFVSREQGTLHRIHEGIFQTLERMRIGVQWMNRNYDRFNSAIKKFL